MNISAIQTQARHYAKLFLRFRVALFLLLLAVLYSFIIVRANSFSTAQPSSKAIASQASTIKHPHIDQATVAKIQQLQDNSVNVQTLFDQARQNPFQE